jgi:hypothetical protein
MLLKFKEDPYVMRKQLQDGEKLFGNDRYKGYCVDLLEKISKIVGFNYTIKLVDDGLYGTIVDGKWNGLVKDLIDKVVNFKAFNTVFQMFVNFTESRFSRCCNDNQLSA